MLERIAAKESVILNRLSHSHADNMGFSRFLNNPSVKVSGLVDAGASACASACVGRKVLVIGDRTQYNFAKFKDRLKPGDLGPLRIKGQLGFFLQCYMAIDQKSGVPLGIADQYYWHRDPKRPNKEKRNYKLQPFEEKESFYWLQRCLQIKDRLGEADHLTFISDSETDIYQLLSELPDEKCDILIRCCRDRSLVGEELRLFDTLAKQESVGSYEVKIRDDRHKNRTKRTTRFEVRIAQVTFNRPSLVEDKYANQVAAYTIEVREDPQRVPPGETPILWRLITSRTVENLEQAKEAVEEYRQRWQIEQLFRTTKKKGIDIESSQVESGKGLKKLAAVAVLSCLRIMMMSIGRDCPEELPATVAFGNKELMLLEILLQKYNGNTEKQKNPYPPKTLKWAIWIIARIGGWKGYNTTTRPGPITMKRGLEEFDNLFEGWNLAWRFMYKE